MGRQDPADNATAKLLEFRDLGLLVGFVALGFVSWLCPQRLWAPVTRAISVCVYPLMRIASQTRSNLIGDVLAVGVDDAAAIEIDNFARRLEEQLQYLREWRPGGWHPDLLTPGCEHIDAALDAGNGCVLWVDPLLYCPLVVKKALHARGIAVAQLSRDYHGPSNSKFGRRFINVVTIGRENRYLAERLSMSPGSRIAATRRMIRILQDDRAVSIACSHHGARIVALPILDGWLPCATGAPSLAAQTKAPLLPVSVRKLSDGRFEVTIGPPLTARLGASSREVVDAMISTYGARLSSLVAADPASFASWRYMRTSEAMVSND